MITRLIGPVCGVVMAFLAPSSGLAACQGTDLIAALPEAERAPLRAATDAVPYPQGNFWIATRDGAKVTIAGTYHLDDPRHDAVVTALAPRLELATTLLVEAGPAEEAALLREMARDPALVLLPDNQTLPQVMPAEDWAALSTALRERQMPPFMAARMQPWYVSMMLAIPPCLIPALQDGKPRGLDARLIDLADDIGLPVRSLEPWDTAFRLFREMPFDAQVEMIRSTLALGSSDDYLVTLSNAYFAEDSRLFWEFQRHASLALPGMTPEKVEAEFALLEAGLMVARNAAWIPVIEAAAADGPVVAAFGALHLAGEGGVLNLLAQNGWTLERLPAP